tara:strand:+ start:1218 stop:1667 length:450 start_codon:yes stop_codon:yes gene_type:complete
MIDKQFYKKYAQDIVNEYREHIFDEAGGGEAARDVFGDRYSGDYSDSYEKAKRGRTLSRRMAKFSESNAPVLTGDLMRDFQGFDLIPGGFRFGTPIRGAVVKNLAKLGRVISNNSYPIPQGVEDFVIDLANKYVKKKLGKIKGATINFK